MDIVYRFGKFQTKEREAMVRRYSFFGLIEYRRYGFGGVYLIVGRKWFTIDEFIKQAKEMVKTKTYQYNSGYQKPAGTPYNPRKTSHQNWSWMGWYKSSWSEFFL